MVGLLAATFYQPIAVNAIYSVLDIVWVTIGFVLLKVYRLPILAIVACFIALGLIMTQVNQAARYKIQVTRYKIQVARYKIQVARYKLQDTSY